MRENHKLLKAWTHPKAHDGQTSQARVIHHRNRLPTNTVVSKNHNKGVNTGRTL